MTQNEHDIWTSYLDKVKDFLDTIDLSKLADEDALQDAFCKYMNSHYYETIREVEIPALKKIDGLGEETWRIDESTRYNESDEYIPCELKFHGPKLEKRTFPDEVDADSKELSEIVHQFSDVHVAMSMFITIKEDEIEKCAEIGNVQSYYKEESKRTFYIRIACIAKSEYAGSLKRKIFVHDYKYYYDKRKANIKTD